MKFESFALPEALQRGISEAGFVECTPVQEKVFDALLREGRDVTVQSQTGTGKTAAYLVPIFTLFEKKPDFANKKALIIVPTRELAVQIQDEAKRLGAYMSYTTACIYGGVGYAGQEKELAEGARIVIGTPGRLIDLMRSGKLQLGDTGVLVIDEADRLFDMGFIKDLRTLLRKMPKPKERISMLLSATLSLKVEMLAWEYQNDSRVIRVEPEQVTVDLIEQRLYHVSYQEKFRVLLGLLHKFKPANAIVFTNTKSVAEELAHRLTKNGFKAQCIMGDLPQNKRLAIIKDLKEGRLQYLVATDVAARGLHIDDLELVVNYDLPDDAENYVHRIGRTARAGKSGQAVSLACERFVFNLDAIESLIGKKIPSELAGEEMVIEDQSAGMSFFSERRRAGQREHGGGRPRDRSRPAGRMAHKPRRDEDSDRQRRNPIHREAGRPALSAREPLGPRGSHVHNEHKRRLGEMNEQERVAYYREKYGEAFDPSKMPSAQQEKRRDNQDRRGDRGRVQQSAGQERRSAQKGPGRYEGAAASAERKGRDDAHSGSQGTRRDQNGRNRPGARGPQSGQGRTTPQNGGRPDSQPAQEKKKKNLFERLLGLFTGRKDD